VRDIEAGEELVNAISKTLPISPTMIVRPIDITAKEKLGSSLWRIEVTAQTAPGREWLIEDFMVDNLREADEQRDGDKIISYGPIVHNADSTAEKRYRRAVGANRPAAAAVKKKRSHRSASK
jgi:hypothetical protein